MWAITSEATCFQSGRYQILRKLGEGRKGIVFPCQDTALNRRVAIKLVKEESFDTEAVRRFQLEVQALAIFQRVQAKKMVEKVLARKEHLGA